MVFLQPQHHSQSLSWDLVFCHKLSKEHHLNLKYYSLCLVNFSLFTPFLACISRSATPANSYKSRNSASFCLQPCYSQFLVAFGTNPIFQFLPTYLTNSLFCRVFTTMYALYFRRDFIFPFYSMKS